MTGKHAGKNAGKRAGAHARASAQASEKDTTGSEGVARPVAIDPRRLAVFERDHWQCVYCGAPGTVETLSVDHVQPRVRGGDQSAGNVVTACVACNSRKGGRRHVEFLADDPEAWRNFRARAPYVWPRLVAAVDEELARRVRRRSTPR